MIWIGMFVCGGLLGVILSKYRWFAVLAASLVTVGAACAFTALRGEGIWAGVGAGGVGLAALQMSYLLMTLGSRRRAPAPSASKNVQKPDGRPQQAATAVAAEALDAVE